jgi:hypothetical protein
MSMRFALNRDAPSAVVSLESRFFLLVRTNTYGGQTAHSIVISVTGIVGRIWSLQRKYSAGTSQVSEGVWRVV